MNSSAESFDDALSFCVDHGSYSIKTSNLNDSDFGERVKFFLTKYKQTSVLESPNTFFSKQPADISELVYSKLAHSEANKEVLNIFSDSPARYGNDCLEPQNTSPIIDLFSGHVVDDWDKTTQMISQLMPSNPKQQNTRFITTEPPGWAKIQREKCIEMAFEALETSEFYISPAPLLSLYSCGLTSGIVMDIGHTQTSFCSVYEGFLLNTVKSPLAGAAIEALLENQFKKQNLLLTSSLQRSVLRFLKSRRCHFLAEKDSKKDSLYVLPDGTAVDMEDALQAPEIFFNPSPINSMLPALPNQLVSVLEKNFENPEVQATVVLTGGSVFAGMADRLRKMDLLNRVPESKRGTPTLTLIEPLEGKWSAFSGACLLSASAWYSLRINRYEYDEVGPTIVHKKCF